MNLPDDHSIKPARKNRRSLPNFVLRNSETAKRKPLQLLSVRVASSHMDCPDSEAWAADAAAECCIDQIFAFITEYELLFPKPRFLMRKEAEFSTERIET